MQQTSRQWTRLETYGPKLVENIVQAFARDCLAETMFNVTESGFNIVMHVHDELILDVPKGAKLRDRTCVMEIWCELFNGDPKQLSPLNSREINEILKGLKGWKKYDGRLRFGKVYGVQRAFIREEE